MRDRGPSDARVGVRRGSLLVSLAAASALVSLAGCLGAGRTPSEEDARLDPARKGSEYETVAASGAWCWFADPRAVRVGAPPAGGERTFAGWVTGDGSVAVAEINNATGEVRSTVIHERLQRDDHDNPALMLRADGRIMAFYSGHGGPDMFLRVSERPFDPSSWGPRRSLRLNKARRGYTYPNPVRLSREAGRIYLFWRGDNWKPCVSWSDDEGGTWTKARIVVSARGAGGGNRPYMKVASDGTERIHLAFTDGHPRNEPTNSIHYACYRDGAFFRADGSRICGMDSVPFEQRSADVVYDGRPDLVRAWIWDVAPDSAGRPVVVYARLPAEDDHRYCYARWDGERWRDGEIVAAGPWFPETAEGRREREPHYSGGIVLDHSDPSVVYLSRRIEGVFEIERWSTPDGGATWSAQRVTSGSEKNNVRPFVARGGRPGERGLFWMHGRYVHYTRYDTCIKMK